MLAYAVTCHKSQGQTLSSAVVHCSQEFVPGLTYVAISRVRSAENVQLLDFNPKFLLAPPQNVLEVSSTNYEQIHEDKSCCCKKVLGEDLFVVNEAQFSEGCSLDEEHFSVPENTVDRMVCSFFERENVPVPDDLAVLWQNINENDSSYSSLPETFNLKTMLNSILNDSPLTPKQERMNECVRELNSNLNIMPFIKLIWYHCFLLFCDHLPDDLDEVVINFSRQAFTGITGHLYSFCQSDKYVQYLKGLFSTEHLSDSQTVVGAEICTKIYLFFLENLARKRRSLQTEEPIPFKISEMLEEGQAKVRHVGAWAIRKVMDKGKKYVRQNMNSLTSTTIQSVYRRFNACNLLENNIVVPFSYLAENSEYYETLQITENRQFRERGLYHISDTTFEFFLLLEQQRVDAINENRLKNLKANLVSQAVEEAKSDKTLQEKWLSCFNHLTASEKVKHLALLYIETVSI